MGSYLWDVDVRTFITHTANQDLDITLRSPAGTVVTLTTDNGGTFDNVFNGTIWDDDANPAGQVPYTDNSGLASDRTYANGVIATSLVPEEAMGAFIGENPNGTWTLTISDDSLFEGGSLASWSLAITSLPTAPSESTFNFSNNTAAAISASGTPLVTSNITVSGAGTSVTDLNLTTTITHTTNQDLDITLRSPAGTVVTLTSDNGGTFDNVFNGTLWDDDANAAGQVPYTNNQGLATDRTYANLVIATPMVPEEAMGAFIGENPNGIWTLTISDDNNNDGGSLANWSLQIKTGACCTIACPSNLNVSNAPGVCGANVSYAAPTSSGCGTVTCSPVSGSLFSIGTTNVTCNTTAGPSCNFNITVNDVQPPTPNVPTNIGASTSAGQCSAAVNYASSAVDNCPGATIICAPASGSTFGLGTTSINCTATDASSNTSAAGFNVTINDNQVPGLTVPSNINVPNDAGLCSGNVSYPPPSATDNCPGAIASCSPVSGTIFGVGTTPVSCTATDAANNSTNGIFSVTVTDAQAPVPVLPSNVSTTTDAGQCSALVNYTASSSDNCPGSSILCNQPSGSSFSLGITAVNCTVTDTSINTANSSFNVTVADAEVPEIAVSADINVGNDSGACSADVSYDAPTVTDNCPGATASCTPNSGSNFALGSNAVNCTATDAADNTADDSFNITVDDTEFPIINAPGAVDVSNDPGLCSADVTYTSSATDNCPDMTFDCAPASGSTFPVGVTPATCTTDAANNESNENFDVTVNDTENPDITCPADVIVPALNGLGVVVNFPAPVIADNCPGPVSVCTPPSGSTFPIGFTSVQCDATDASANTANCLLTVTVGATSGNEIAIDPLGRFVVFTDNVPSCSHRTLLYQGMDGSGNPVGNLKQLVPCASVSSDVKGIDLLADEDLVGFWISFGGSDLNIPKFLMKIDVLGNLIVPSRIVAQPSGFGSAVGATALAAKGSKKILMWIAGSNGSIYRTIINKQDFTAKRPRVIGLQARNASSLQSTHTSGILAFENPMRVLKGFGMDKSGKPGGTSWRLSPSTDGGHKTGGISADGLMALSMDDDPPTDQLYAQPLQEDGSPNGDPLVVGSATNILSVDVSNALASGRRFVVYAFDDGTQTKIYLQKVDSITGAKIGARVLVN